MKKALKVIMIIAAVVLVASIFSLCSGTSPRVASVSKASTSAPAAEQTPDYSNMSVGDSVTLESGLTITVNEVQTFTPQYSSTPQTRVNVTYQNNGNDKQAFNLLDWKAENTDGVERHITISTDDSTHLDSGDLKPGGHVTGNVYFDGDDLVRVYYYGNLLLHSDSDVCWNL